MAKFAVGETVEKTSDDHEDGIVVAVFPTLDGSFRYAVDMEGYGTLQFFAEEKLAAHPAGPAIKSHARPWGVASQR